jgi:hypothetical protein
MLDYFSVAGPNGTHDCLVLQLLGPNIPDAIETFFHDERLPATLAKSVARQVLLGLDFLSQNEIGHGGKSKMMNFFTASNSSKTFTQGTWRSHYPASTP